MIVCKRGWGEQTTIPGRGPGFRRRMEPQPSDAKQAKPPQDGHHFFQSSYRQRQERAARRRVIRLQECNYYTFGDTGFYVESGEIDCRRELGYNGSGDREQSGRSWFACCPRQPQKHKSILFTLWSDRQKRAVRSCALLSVLWINDGSRSECCHQYIETGTTVSFGVMCARIEALGFS